MADEKKRPWYALTRVQGLFIAVAGVAMLFNPLTTPHAGQVIAVGLGWAAGGVNAAETRKIFNKLK